MFKRIACILAVGIAFGPLAAAPAPAAPAAADSAPSAAERSGRMSVDGVDYYYEVHGRGEPLLLLHGGLGQIEMFGPVLPALAATRTVIAVDLHGHGRTPLGSRPFRLESMGEDMATVVERLGHRRVDVVGYSLGGGVALHMAARRPQSVRRLALVSVGYSDDGFYPELREMQKGLSGAAAPMMRDTPMYKSYAAVAPNVDEFPRLLDVLGDFMRQSYDYSSEVAKLKMPVMLVYGDGDMFRPEHMVKFYQLLGGGLRDAGWQREHLSQNRLAILPGFTHYDLFVAPQLAATLLPFLDGEQQVASWAEQVDRAP